MRRGILAAAAIMAGAGLAPAEASANERRFTYSYETGVLPPGAAELELWSTARLGREDRYTRFDERLELEVGVTERLRTALYLNFTSVSQVVDLGTERALVDTFEFGGVSSEWKYKLSDPVADALGTGLYGEVTFAPHEVELEAKFLVDRRSGDLLLAANLIGEAELEFELGETKKEYKVELTGGAAYFVTPRLSLGLEARLPTIFEVEEDETVTLSALYAGPVIGWAEETWWTTLTVMPQIAGLATEEEGESRELHENEKVNVRLLFSFHL